LHASLTNPCTPSLYALSLHDALPIYSPHSDGCLSGPFPTIPSYDSGPCPFFSRSILRMLCKDTEMLSIAVARCAGVCKSMGSRRSEEHTSELQSHLNLVCRLLLEKKK